MRSDAESTEQEDERVRAIALRLDHMASGLFHHRLAAIVGFGLVVDSVEIAIGASIGGALLASGLADLEALSGLAIATTLGLAGGGLLAGMLADRFGRIVMMRANMALIVLVSAAAVFAPTVEVLTALRFVAALGLGAETVLAYGVLTEFMPARTRGRWIAWVALLASIGLPAAMGLGVVLAPRPDGWRMMLGITAIAALIVCGLRLLLPESPRWLAQQGRFDAAERMLAKMQTRLVAPNVAGATSSRSDTSQNSEQHTVLPRRLLPPWRSLIVGSAIHIAAMIAVYGFVTWLPAFFVSGGRDVASSSAYAAVFTLGAPTGTAIAFLVSDRFERKWSVVVSALAAVISGAFYAHAEASMYVLTLGFLTVSAIYLFATLGVMTYTPEIFPTASRMSGISLVSTTGRLGAIGAPLAAPFIFQIWGQAGVIGAVAVVLLFSAALVASLGRDVSGGALT